MAYRVTSNRRRERTAPHSYSWSAVVVGVILILIGFAIIAYWVNFAYRGNMPQGLWTVENNQYIVFHQAAEYLMALLAIVGGIGLLAGRGWGMATSLVALGALLYTSVNSLAFSLKSAPNLTPIFLAVGGTVLLCFVGLHWSRRY